MPTRITKKMLRTMLEAFGGMPMTDAEMEAVLPMVRAYAKRASRFQELDLSNVLSTRMLRVEEGERRVK